MSPVYSKNFKTSIKCRSLLVLSEFFKQGSIKLSLGYVSFLVSLPLFSLKGCINYIKWLSQNAFRFS